MKTQILIASLFCFLLIGKSVNAQSALITANEKDKNKDVLQPPAQIVVAKVAAEPTLTPEEQGFEKFVQSDNSVIYIKKVDNITLEYKPE